MSAQFPKGRPFGNGAGQTEPVQPQMNTPPVFPPQADTASGFEGQPPEGPSDERNGGFWAASRMAGNCTNGGDGSFVPASFSLVQRDGLGRVIRVEPLKLVKVF